MKRWRELHYMEHVYFNVASPPFCGSVNSIFIYYGYAEVWPSGRVPWQRRVRMSLSWSGPARPGQVAVVTSRPQRAGWAAPSKACCAYRSKQRANWRCNDVNAVFVDDCRARGSLWSTLRGRPTEKCGSQTLRPATPHGVVIALVYGRL